MHLVRPRGHRAKSAPKQQRGAAKFEVGNGSEEAEEWRVKTASVNTRGANGLSDGGQRCTATFSRESCGRVAAHCRGGGAAGCHYTTAAAAARLNAEICAVANLCDTMIRMHYDVCV